jgi:hypothetical protein
MRIRRLKSLLFLVSLIVFSGCASQNNQPKPTSQNEKTIAPQPIRVSASDVNSSEPAIASTKDGTVFVVWVEHNADKSADVMLQQYDSNGQLKGEKVRVNPQIGQATAWRGDPPTLAVGQDGLVYIGWTEKVESKEGQATNLYLSVSRDGGRSFDAPVKANDDTVPSEHGMHSLAVNDKGRIFMAWLDERYLKTDSSSSSKEESTASKDDMKMEGMEHHHKEPNREIYFAVSSDGGKSFSANKRLAGDVCPCCKTSILAATDNRVYVSWRQVLTDDFRHIAVAASDDDGSSFSSLVIVSNDQWQINACPVSGASLTTNSDNTLNVAWLTAGKAGAPGLYSTKSKDGGKTFLPRTLISESVVSGTPVLLADGTMRNIVVWEDNGKIMSATLDKENLNVEDKQEISEGQLPASTTNGEKLFVSYVKKENDRGGIWLASLNK